MKYCANCGKEILENADVCVNCGKLINPQKNKIPGKGKSIASMILGIISIIWSFMMLLSLEQSVETLIVEMYYNQLVAYFIGYYIGFTLFSLVPSIVGLILGIKGNKATKNGKALAGVITSSISLLICIISLIIFIVSL